MSSRISIPKNYSFNIGGGMSITVPLMNVNSKVEVKSEVTGDKNHPVSLRMTGDDSEPIVSTIQGNPNKPITTTVQGNRNQPVATEIELLNIPRLSKQDLKDLLTPEIRMRIPNYNQVCFNWFGMELFSICTSGESQIITEPYVPNAYERCELPCCEADTRPFPEQGQNSTLLDSTKRRSKKEK
ncbi:MAG TPA: hypothetical protein ENK52_05330 [Saprospiraceae bacterium]|nr:hypothetical protein [Saprospiraceae bacterium]